MHGYVCFVLSAKSFPSIKSNITSSRACCTILFIHITQMKPAFLSLRATHVCFSKVRLRKDILHILEHRKSDISVQGSDGHSYSRTMSLLGPPRCIPDEQCVQHLLTMAHKVCLSKLSG